MAENYDHVVVGSGIAGLTATLLLARCGRRVLLVEKAPYIGGSLRRFRYRGIPFDTGFHFTGSLNPGGLLDDMLIALDMRDRIVPVFPEVGTVNQFMMEPDGKLYNFPAGIPEIIGQLKDYFPGDAQAVERYFDMVKSVCRETGSMNIRHEGMSVDRLDEDFVSLQEVLDGLTDNRTLKALLSGFCMCYGSAPADVSFADHSRICIGMYESVAKVENGGDAFVEAFADAFKTEDVDILCRTEVEECLDVKDKRVGGFRLSDGREVTFESAVFAIHPHLMLQTLPPDKISNGFIHRLSDFEPSSGFFAVFGLFGTLYDTTANIISIYPSDDVNRMVHATEREEDSAIVLIRSREVLNGKPVHAVTALEVSEYANIAAWAETHTGRRPQEYLQYKARKTTRMCERVNAMVGHKFGDLKPFTSSSMLTFRDYLNSPDGSAYGIRQQVGQIKCIGRLPLRNLFAAGQSALQPGVVGAMMSSFIVVRTMLDRDLYQKSIIGKL